MPQQYNSILQQWHATEYEEAREREQCNDESCSVGREVGSNGNHMTTLLILGGSNKSE